MLRVYESSRSFGRASRIELCTVSLPMCNERTPKRSLTYTVSSSSAGLRARHFDSSFIIGYGESLTKARAPRGTCSAGS